mgnify:FL=1
MKVGDKINVDIVRLGDNAEGIGKIDEKVVFVTYAPNNSNCEIRIDKISKNYINATLIKVNSSKMELLTPLCANFTKCGGCDTWYYSYEYELEYKRKKVEDVIKKFAGTSVRALPVIYGKDTLYRNKIELFTKCVDGRVRLGQFKKESHEFVAIDRCLLCDKWLDQVIEIFNGWVNLCGLKAYDEQTNKGLLKGIVVRYLGGKLVLTVVVNGDGIREIDSLSKKIGEKFDSYSVYICKNKKKGNRLLTKDLVKVYDDEKLILVDNVKCSVSPLSFFQVNDEVRAKLYNEVVKEVKEGEIIIDAYSGVGLLTNQLSKKASDVFGVEIVKDAVKDADNLAALNGNYGKITNICGDSALILPKLVSAITTGDKEKLKELVVNNSSKKDYKGLVTSGKEVTIVLDPPRKGADVSVLSAVNESGAKRVIYVSCNPITLARDLKILADTYKIVKVQPFDLFPKTSHVETLCVLTRK